MVIGPVSNSALLGIQRGMNGLRENAANIASAAQLSNAQGAEKPDLERNLVEMHVNSHYTKASVKAFSVQERLIGFLLDEMA